MKRIVVEVDDDLHRRLKLHCVKKAESIKDEIIALVCGVLDSEELPEKEPPKENKNKDDHPPFIVDSQTGIIERQNRIL